MLLAVFSNYLIFISILGYSFLLKRLTFKKSKIEVKNIDFLYGLFLLIFISLIVNFFSPLGVITLPVIIFGLFVFLYGFFKKIFSINFFGLFLIFIVTTFIAFYNNMNIDSPMYHLQIIKWLTYHKISFGLSNLEIRLGFNSSWHSFLALMDFKILQFSLKYYLSSFVLASLIYESIRSKKKINYSDIFLYLTISYLIFYSFLHPYLNGVILNHLGNPERDIIGMLFFFLVIFFFLKCIENQNNNNFIILLTLSLFLCITSRLTMFPMMILLFFILYKNKNYKFFNLTYILISITTFFWVLRSFILSGCLFFPFSKTCFNTDWAVNVEEVEFFVNEAMRISRTLPTRNGVNDLDFSLNGYNWISQWVNDYFFSTALLQIGSVIILVSIICIIIRSFYKKNKINGNYIKSDIAVLFCLIFIISLWFLSAPEIRYALGPLISLPCFVIIIFLKRIDFLKFVRKKNLRLSYILGALCLLLMMKSVGYFKFYDLFIISKKNHNYTHIVKYGTFSDKNFYWGNFLCADFREICVNTIKKNYVIEKILNYDVYKSDTWLK